MRCLSGIFTLLICNAYAADSESLRRGKWTEHADRPESPSGENASSFLLKQQQNTLSGIFFENYAANEFVAKGLPLYYWKGKSSAEMEFVVDSGNNIIPVDVKRGRSSLNSLVKFRNHNKNNLAVKLSGNQFGYSEDQKLLTVPLYQCFLLAEALKDGQLFNRE